MKNISIVVPFLNEEKNLPVLVERTRKTMAERPDVDWELLLVDDGSTDGSAGWVMEEALRDPRVKLLQFSRNFGHQIAITAGLDHAVGDAVVIMDADLQDPPEVIPKLLAEWEKGVEVVYAIRRSRAGETWLKKFLAKSFYRVFRRLAKVNVPMDAGDFRLVDRCVVDALKEMRELHRFMRGLTCWVGFRQGAVEYDRAARFAGETKYPVWKSAQLAFDAITSFSASPLRWMVGLGLAVCGIGGLWVLRMIWLVIFNPGSLVRGWTSLIAIIVLLSGVQLICLGMLGQYVSRIFEEGKRRPLYLLKKRVTGLPSPQEPDS